MGKTVYRGPEEVESLSIEVVPYDPEEDHRVRGTEAVGDSCRADTRGARHLSPVFLGICLGQELRVRLESPTDRVDHLGDVRCGGVLEIGRVELAGDEILL